MKYKKFYLYKTFIKAAVLSEVCVVKCLLIFISCKQVYCEAVNNGGLPREPYQFKVAYDKLVIAAGAEALTFGIKGVTENAFFLRDVNHAQEIRKELLLNLMLSENPGGYYISIIVYFEVFHCSFVTCSVLSDLSFHFNSPLSLHLKKNESFIF